MKLVGVRMEFRVFIVVGLVGGRVFWVIFSIVGFKDVLCGF